MSENMKQSDSLASPRKAPAWSISHWINANQPHSLETLRGKVIVLEAFQMLCPSCVAHSLPQAQKVHQLFHQNDVAVIGLHSVFEHHEAQGTQAALEAFVHEYRLSFPIGIDKQSGASGLPLTMSAYGMRGTPTTILIDRNGYIRKHKFGRDDDMVLGAEIMSLLREDGPPLSPASRYETATASCTDEGCVAPQS